MVVTVDQHEYRSVRSSRRNNESRRMVRVEVFDELLTGIQAGSTAFLSSSALTGEASSGLRIAMQNSGLLVE